MISNRTPITGDAAMFLADIEKFGRATTSKLKIKHFKKLSPLGNRKRTHYKYEKRAKTRRTRAPNKQLVEPYNGNSVQDIEMYT